MQRPNPLNMIFSNATCMHAKYKKKYRKYEQYYTPNLVYSNGYRKYKLHKSPFFSQGFEKDVSSPESRLFPIVGRDGNP